MTRPRTQFKPLDELRWLRMQDISRTRAALIVARRWWLYRQAEKIRRERALT